MSIHHEIVSMTTPISMDRMSGDIDVLIRMCTYTMLTCDCVHMTLGVV